MTRSPALPSRVARPASLARLAGLVAGRVRRSAGDWLELLAPLVCEACDVTCDPPATYGRTPDHQPPGVPSPHLCPACYHALATLEAVTACPRCGTPRPAGSGCVRCHDRRWGPFDRVTRLGAYAEPLRHLVHAVKFAGRWTLAERLADRLASKMREAGVATDVLVGVPLHPLRQIARGFDQADVIARRLSLRLGVPVAYPLRRVVRTSPQSLHLSRRDRVANVRGAFDLTFDPRGRGVSDVRSCKSLRDRHVTLVDDVMTTGATLRAAARVLRDVRPSGIGIAVLAASDPARPDPDTRNPGRT